MITIISGSNRKDNLTIKFAKYAYELIRKTTDTKVSLIDFSRLDTLEVDNQFYAKDDQPEVIKLLQDDSIIPATKFWFFVPEYNGSYPGIVKLVLDCLSVRASKESFEGKKACLTGIALGRAGNLRGMDHLADVLNHLGVHVHPNKAPISSIYNFFDSDKKIKPEEVEALLRKQVDELLIF